MRAPGILLPGVREEIANNGNVTGYKNEARCALLNVERVVKLRACNMYSMVKRRRICCAL